MSDIPSDAGIFFEAETPLGFRVRTTVSYWALITTVKHPMMRGREEDVRVTLMAPDEVRVSKSDAAVYLFYRADGPQRWVCAVAKREHGEGFLITAYRTSGIKEGIRVWPR
jgi:hypothetical protein